MCVRVKMSASYHHADQVGKPVGKPRTAEFCGTISYHWDVGSRQRLHNRAFNRVCVCGEWDETHRTRTKERRKGTTARPAT